MWKNLLRRLRHSNSTFYRNAAMTRPASTLISGPKEGAIRRPALMKAWLFAWPFAAIEVRVEVTVVRVKVNVVEVMVVVVGSAQSEAPVQASKIFGDTNMAAPPKEQSRRGFEVSRCLL